MFIVNGNVFNFVFNSFVPSPALVVRTLKFHIHLSSIMHLAHIFWPFNNFNLCAKKIPFGLWLKWHQWWQIGDKGMVLTPQVSRPQLSQVPSAHTWRVFFGQVLLFCACLTLLTFLVDAWQLDVQWPWESSPSTHAPMRLVGGSWSHTKPCGDVTLETVAVLQQTCLKYSPQVFWSPTENR